MRSNAFFDGGDKDEQQDFLNELKVCWLYCPDEVLRKAYAFLTTVEGNFKGTADERKDALRELALAIRKDMMPWYRRTRLEAKEFKLLKANR
jgi:hypothetical protein